MQVTDNAPQDSHVPLEGVVNLFSAMTTHNFCKSLLKTASTYTPIDHCSLMRISTAQGVQVFGTESLAYEASAARAAVAYMDHFHRYEPNRRLLARWPDESVVLRRHTANEIDHRTYRRVCYEDNGLADRLSIVTRDETGVLFVVNFYRQRESSEFSATELGRLRTLSPLFSIATMRHLQLLLQAPADAEAWRTRLKGACPALTGRELDVAAGMLSGSSLREMADRLDLSLATVVTYRSRAYARLGVGSLKELRGLFTR